MTDRRRRNAEIEALARQLDSLLDELDESVGALGLILERPAGQRADAEPGSDERTAAP